MELLRKPGSILVQDSLFIPFYEKQIFLLSGVTGFLGKIFLHKLLTTFPNLPDNSIYVVVRGKNDKSAEERFTQVVFDECLLFQGNVSGLRSKIKVIDGDMSERRLGMKEKDYSELCERVTMIFHMAATVNFNENLRNAIELNTFGVKRMIELAHKTKNLVSFVHTSTTYVNSPRHKLEIKEKVYPIPYDPDEIAEKISRMTHEEAEINTTKFINQHPNTYTFTKFLAEHILMKEKGILPFSIVRPAIIGSAYRYPVPGWVDSYTAGPAGIMLAAGLGAIHVMHGIKALKVEMIPVDIVVDTLLAAGYATGTGLNKELQYPIYHCATAFQNPTFWGSCVDIMMAQFSKHPGNKQVSKPWLAVYKGKTFKFMELLLHTLPALILDKKAELLGGKVNNLKKLDIMKKIIHHLSYFTSHEWVFDSDNVIDLFEKMNTTDRILFNIDVSERSINWELYWIIFQQGMVKFLLKDISKEETTWLAKSKL